MIQFRRPETKIDLTQLSATVAKAVVNVIRTNPAGIASNAIDAISGALGEPEQTAETQAWNWMIAVLSQATAEFLAEPRLRSPLSADELSPSIESLLKTLPENGEVAPEHLIHPAINVHFQAAVDLVPGIAARAAPEHGLDEEALRTLFRRALSDASGRVLARDTSAYNLISAALQSPMSSAQMREVAWRRHANWIRQRFTQDPIFSPDSDVTIPLAHVYLRTRCYWHTEEETPNPDGEDSGHGHDRREPEAYRKAHLGDLHDTILGWLAWDPPTDPIRVVAGGPGCGKSSFARAFATEVIDRDKLRLVFIPLQYLRRSGDLSDDIGRYLTSLHQWVNVDACQGFPENPLDWRGSERRPILLIFDGLDEMSSEERVATEISRQFLFALRQMLTPLNIGPAPTVRAIVLGRSASCQDALKEAGMGLHTMLNVAKITPLKRSDLELSDSEDFQKPDLDADTNLMDRDDRGQYWKRWRHVRRIEGDDMPEAVTSEKIRDLNAEPLLLHLLITSDYIGDKWEQAAENPNLVYRDILSKIHDRNREKEGDSPAKSLGKAEFFTLMECLGLAAWHGNGRTGTAEEFRELRDKHAKKEKRKFSKIDAAELKTVALQVHTRKGIGNEGFEFIHKSFGEYLSASALISAASRLSDRLRNEDLGIDPGDAAREWADIIGSAELTPFVMTFLQREAPLALTQDRAVQIKTDLEKVLGWVQLNGMPVQSLYGDASYRELETLQRCAESALVVTATAITTAAQDSDAEEDVHLSIPWPAQRDGYTKNQDVSDRYAVFRALDRLHATTRAPVARGLALLDLRGVNLSRANLYGANLYRANLCRANLYGTDLSRANLSRANLREADLRGANLFRANLNGTKLPKAHLRGAVLDRADLDGAKVYSADLYGADLNGVKLSGADLSRVNLCEANLRGADLSTADLHGADLGRANLGGAALSEANFKSAHFDSCDLKHADLTEALGLTQEQIDSAKGGKKTTKLPEGLEYPDGWDDD